MFGNIEKECVEYVAGYVAHRFISKYPYLKTEDHSTEKNSWIQHLSKGHLTVPSPLLVTAAHALEKLFKELHGDALTNKPNIIRDLSAQLETTIRLPLEVIKCLVRTRTFMRMNKLNNCNFTNNNNKNKKAKFSD